MVKILKRKSLGVCKLEIQGKSYQNHPKSGKVRELEKNVMLESQKLLSSRNENFQ